MKAVVFFCLISGLLVVNRVFGQEGEPPSEREIEIAQWNVDHNLRLYQAAIGLNDLNSAKGALLNVLVEIPKNDSLLFELGRIYFQLQEYASAALCAQEVLKSFPDNIGALEMAAISFDNIGAKDKAANNYELLYLKTDNFQSLYKTALLQFDLERYKESYNNLSILSGRKEADELTIPALSTANVQKNYPVKVVILNLMGMIKKDEGDKDEAKRLFNEALKISPDIASVNENLTLLNKN